MAASGTPGRRAAIWPWLVMPVVVLAAFYTLKRVRERPGPPVVTQPQQVPPAAPAATQ